MTATEYVILVDQHDQQIGTAEKLYAHQHALLHRAFSVFVYREVKNKGKSAIEWLLQQRAQHKYHSSLLWTNTCCSHPRPHETTLAAALRRLQEEMGIATVSLHLGGLFQYKAVFENGLAEHEMDHVFIGRALENVIIKMNAHEVAAYRWIETAVLQDELALHPEQFTPWFQTAWELARELFFLR